MSRSNLTVNILTKDSASRLERLLLEVSQFADEILVGVDEASQDGTLTIAQAHADVVYRFEHSPQLAPARMLPFEYASGEWILSLDDDESMEPSFDALLPELLADPRPTHYWFPRKWVTSMMPPEYVHAVPWFPDWQLRLFRNDRSLVWKPNRPHSGYQVQGPGYFEARAAVLHFEPLVISADQRRAKVDRYRAAGGVESGQRVFDPIPPGPRRPVRPREEATPRARARPCVTHANVHRSPAGDLPPWGSVVTTARMPDVMTAGEWVIAEVTVENTGRLAWTPRGTGWPDLALGTHVLHDDGRLLQWDGRRTELPRLVTPGQQVTFLAQFQAPAAPGHYLVEWDSLSEGECWFAQCGGTVLRTPFEVR